MPVVSAANTRNVPITTMLLTIGANAGSANFPCALSRPSAIAANPYSAIWGANSWRKNVARACCSRPSGPGTRPLNTSMISGASRTVATLIATRTARAVVTSADTDRQASARTRVRSSSTSTGMNTEESTPPSTSS